MYRQKYIKYLLKYLFYGKGEKREKEDDQSGNKRMKMTEYTDKELLEFTKDYDSMFSGDEEVWKSVEIQEKNQGNDSEILDSELLESGENIIGKQNNKILPKYDNKNYLRILSQKKKKLDNHNIDTSKYKDINTAVFKQSSFNDNLFEFINNNNEIEYKNKEFFDTSYNLFYEDIYDSKFYSEYKYELVNISGINYYKPTMAIKSKNRFFDIDNLSCPIYEYDTIDRIYFLSAHGSMKHNYSLALKDESKYTPNFPDFIIPEGIHILLLNSCGINLDHDLKKYCDINSLFSEGKINLENIEEEFKVLYENAELKRSGSEMYDLNLEFYDKNYDENMGIIDIPINIRNLFGTDDNGLYNPNLDILFRVNSLMNINYDKNFNTTLSEVLINLSKKGKKGIYILSACRGFDSVSERQGEYYKKIMNNKG